MKSSQAQNLLPKLLLHIASYKREGGYAVLMAVSATIVITSLLAAYFTLVSIETSTTLASLNNGYGFDAAEAGLNVRADTVREIFQGFNLPSGTEPDIDNDPCVLPGNQGTGDFVCQNINFNNYNIQTYLIREDGAPDAAPREFLIPPGEDFALLNSLEYRYSAYSTATRNGEDNPQAILQMIFRSRLIPMFQFAVFYQNDLEILPGPAFDLRGRVHTNGDLYLNAGNRLTIGGDVTVGGDLYRGRKNNASCGGTVEVTSGSNTYPISCDGGRRGPIIDNTYSEVANSDGAIDVEIQQLQLPPAQAVDPNPDNPDAEYWQQGDLRLVLNINPSNLGAAPALTQFDGTTPVQLSNSNRPFAGTGNNVRPEIRNADGTLDITRTNLLNQCVAPQPDLFDSRIELPPVYVGGANAGSLVFDESDNEVRTRVLFNTIDGNYGGGRDYRDRDPADPGTGGTVRLHKDNGNDTNYPVMRLGHPNYDGTVPGTYVEQLMYPGQFYNRREDQNITMMDVNVRQLLDCIRDPDLDPSTDTPSLIGATGLADATEGGLVIHMTIADDPASNDPMRGKTEGVANGYGIRLWNAETLDPLPDDYVAQGIDPTDENDPLGDYTLEIQGLTVVSDQAIYVQGNYNCRRRFVGEDPTNERDGLVNGWMNGCAPIGGNTTLSDDINNRYPASILADTIHPLSNAWNIWLDDGRYRVGNGREASQTTIFAAYLANTETTGAEGRPGGTYGGGLENYPRFHEDWGGVRNFYRGSMISFGNPRFYDGNHGSQQYTPPQRDWNYELRFNTADGLPPLSPRFVVLRQELFVRDFDR